MATHARQQYFADESSLSKEKREFSIAEEVQQKIDSIEEGAQVNKIETIKVNGSEVQPDENKAVDLTIPGVVDSLDSTSSTDALSAKQGKVLYDYIQDVSHIGHFLALWDASTGLPVTDPETSPYIYNTGDFYTVSVVASGGGTNYKPDGTQYVIGQASTTVDTDNVAVNDFYFYDGATWRHMKNSGAGSIAVDGSLSTTSTNPVENRVITNALNGKADATDINTKTFFLADRDDLTTAQAAIDWYRAGNNPIIKLGNSVFLLHNINSSVAKFVESTYFESNSGGVSQYLEYVVDFNMSNRTVTSISPHGQNMVSYLDTMRTPTGTFTPTLDWQPATKKYVDDHAGTTYTAGANIQISNENVISATDTKAEWGNITGTLSNQTDLQNALNTKADNADINTKTFYLSSTSDLTNAQAAVDWLIAGKNPIVKYAGYSYICTAFDSQTSLLLTCTDYDAAIDNSSVTKIKAKALDFSLNSNNEVTAISMGEDRVTRCLSTDINYPTPYVPQYDGSPATKKYVDDNINTKTFYLSNTSDLTNAQAAVDWFLSGKNPIIYYSGAAYSYAGQIIFEDNKNGYRFVASAGVVGGSPSGQGVTPSSVENFVISLKVDSSNTVTNIYSETLDVDVLPAFSSSEVVYTPINSWDPATKKYVDDNSTNTKTFHLATNDLTTGQAIYDWISQGKYAIVYLYSANNGYKGPAFFDPTTTTTGEIVSSELMTPYIFPNGDLTLGYGYIKLVVSAGTVTAVQRSIRDESTGSVVIVNSVAPSNPVDGNLWFDTTTNTLKVFRNFQPLGQGRRQDLGGATSSATTPTNSYEGMLRYDTTNDKLKVYDGTNWNEVGKEYTAGEGIIIGHIGYKNKGPAPEGYHMPTSAEFKSIHTMGVNIGAWTTESGTPVSTYLRMPYAGARDYTSGEWRTSGGNYWTCSGRRTSVTATNRLSGGTWGFNDTSNDAPSTTSGLISQYGFPIRALKNEYVAPDSSWTTAFDGSSHAAGAGIFRNETLGLISISDGTTGYTLADKNLGATQVYTYGDELTDANCGSLFQWGNNYAFPRTGTVTTATGVVNVDGYGPLNPYSSSTFYLYTTPRGWAYGGASDNLWGGEEAGERVIPGDGNIIENILPFDPSNYGSTGQLLTKTSSGYDWETKYTLPTGTATTGYVLTKIGTSASAYAWRQGGLQKASNSPMNIQYFWAGTQAEYDALESYSDDTVYFTI